MIKNYSVSLDHEVVEAAKRKLKNEKLSPKINQLLKDWANKIEEEPTQEW